MRGLVILLALALPAGCLGGDASVAEDDGPPPEEDGGSPTPPPAGSGNATPPDEEPALESPQDVHVRDEGDVAGAFEDAWSWPVESNAFTTFVVRFNLTGTQDLPVPTARVNVRVLDANDRVIEQATVGLGGVPSVEWAIGVEDVVSRGDWRLEAHTPEDEPLPSGGAAHWQVAVDVVY